MENLEEFLKGDEPVAEAVETPAPVEPEAVETQPEAAERPRGPDGKFIPKGEPETPAGSASPAPVEPALDHPALLGERRRRQELEQRLAELEARVAPPQQQQVQGPPDRWEDPEGYDRWLEQRITAAAEQRAVEAFQYQRIAAAASQFKADRPDYDQVISVFGQMAQANDGLIQQMQQSENPAKFAYDTAKLQLDIQQYGGLQEYIQAQVAAAQPQVQPAPQAQSIPETLADAQSSRGAAASVLTIPSLDDIVRRR